MLSYFNVKKAMDYYISKGGSAKFIICDDGFQVRAIPHVLSKRLFRVYLYGNLLRLAGACTIDSTR
jgi:hypothetical protein